MREWFICMLVMAFLVMFTPRAHSQYTPDAEVADTTFLNSHSPHKATFYSCVLPGLGQVYNQKYWKVPIIYAGFGGLIYYAGYNNQAYQSYYDQYQQKLLYDAGKIEEDPDPSRTAISIAGSMDTWRRYRDLCFIGMGLLYVAQIIDADVDAHLFDYDISEDLSMRIEPVIMPQFIQFSAGNNDVPVGLRCAFRF